MTDFAAKFSDENNHKRKEDGGGHRHFPVQPREDADENDQTESLLKKVGEIFRESHACAFHVVDGGGEKAADRIVLKEGDGLADDFGADLIADIGDRGLSDILELRDAQILGEGLCQIQSGQRDGKESCNVVETGGENIIEVDNTVAGEGEQNGVRDKNGRMEDVVNGYFEHESD
jgi:hypothetical protein